MQATLTAWPSQDGGGTGLAVVPSHVLVEQYERIRNVSVRLCDPLQTEDFVVQTMSDVSPTKWHLAHTTWFFEAMVLRAFVRNYRPYHPDFLYLFNSYYNALGPQFHRPHRGTLSRPTVREIFAYRDFVDARMLELLHAADDDRIARLAPVIQIGLNHEQQHQELMLTDIKHVFATNPLRPVYAAAEPTDAGAVRAHDWIAEDGGLREIGHAGGDFAYDNESPRHQVLVLPFAIASRLVTNEEFLTFMEDGGYDRSDLWLSDGWNTVQSRGWRAPLYWERRGGRWKLMTLAGMRPVNPDEPVCHVSFYEADAYARWAGARLLTEAEWEVTAETAALQGNLLEASSFHPRPAPDGSSAAPAQLFGDVWEWTASPYRPYPGYRPPDGALGEYNGKFMCNQMVLRGGSCVTPQSHIRRTYRNFFPPDARWQFAGIRLGRDAS